MTTIPDGIGLHASVLQAIEELKLDLQPSELFVEPDGQGGARIRLSTVALSATYAQKESWIGAHIPAQIPYADIYPIFLRGDLSRADGKPLVAPMTAGHTFMGQPAVQVSRKSNRRDPAIETAKLKLKKVLHWVNSQ